MPKHFSRDGKIVQSNTIEVLRISKMLWNWNKTTNIKGSWPFLTISRWSRWLWSWPTSWRKSTSNVGTRASRPNSLEDFIYVAHIFFAGFGLRKKLQRRDHISINCKMVKILETLKPSWKIPMTQGNATRIVFIEETHFGILLRTRTYHLRNDKVWISSTGKIFSWNRIFLFLWKYFVKSFLNTIQ